MIEAIALQPSRVARWVPAIVPPVVATTAALVLLGWVADIELFKSLLHGGRVAMNPSTALSFILAAVSLWLQKDGRPASSQARRVAAACAIIVLVVAACRLGVYLDWWQLRFDGWMFASRLNGNVMAPNTATAFALVSAALLTMEVRSPSGFHLAVPFLLTTAAIAVLSLVGYLFDVTSFYGVRGAIPMSLNAAILFALLSAGAICSRPEREPLRTVLSPTLGGVVARRLIPAAFLVPLLLGVILIWAWDHTLLGITFGTTLFVLAVIVVFNALIWWSARVIQATDTGRQKISDELRLSEQRYHAIMRQTAEGIYLVDLDSYTIVETNIAMEKMLGYGSGELDGMPVYELVQDSAEHVAARLASLKASRLPLQGERQYLRKDGTPLDVYAGATVISYGDRTVACTVLHDVTERNRALKLLQEKHDQLETAVAAERAAISQLRLAQSRLVQSEKLASLGQMVAGVAHEINNPLAFVSNNVAVLERDTRGLCRLLELYAKADEWIGQHDADLLDEIRDLVESMDLAYTQSNLANMMTRSRDGLRRIQQIVKDLRDFARLDESDLHEVDLNQGIESTVNIVAGRAKKKRVTLNLELSPMPPVSCFPAKINQVVMNLVANAIDACPEGGQVNVTSGRDDDGGIRIVVADNGTGVPANIRERIFDPFFTTKPQGEGTGLGLSISYGIIHDHGGSIALDDAPGGGARFTVTLPLCGPQKHSEGVQSARA